LPTGLSAPGDQVVRQRGLVVRRLHFVAHRRDGLHVGHHRVEVAKRHDLVERVRHLRDRHTVWPHALGHHFPDVGIAPGADAGFAIRRNVGALHGELRFVEHLRAAGEAPAHVEAARPARRMAAIAAHDRVDEIGAALDRRLRERGRGQACRSQHGRRQGTKHPDQAPPPQSTKYRPLQR
jgi:hypothetical protein